MKRIMYPAILLFALLVSISCDKQKVDPNGTDGATKDELLIRNAWQLTNITDPSGKAVPQNQLGIETLAIYLFDIQFFENNVTKAFDRTTKQVINGGTWFLINDRDVLDIEVSQFKGKFTIRELNKSKLILSNSIPVSGVNKDTFLVFSPVVK